MKNCHYSSMINTEFVLNPLPSNISNYQHIYIAQSRQSKHLPASYAGMKGKFTGNIEIRDYPKQTFWRAQSLLDRVTLYDDGYEDLYMSPTQKEARDRKAKFVVRQEILQNCQIIYIAIDSLVKDRDNLTLIESNDVSICK